MFFLDHIYLVPLLPALGAAIMLFFGKKLQKSTVNAVCVGVVVLAFLFSCLAVLQYTNLPTDGGYYPYQKIIYTWLGSDTGHLNYALRDGSAAPFRADVGMFL